MKLKIIQEIKSIYLARENQGVFNKICGIQRRQRKDATLPQLEERARENQGVFSYAN